MDSKLNELLMREQEARCYLEYAVEAEEVKKAINQLNKAMSVTSAYLIFKKKEHEYESISTHEQSIL